MEVCNRQSEFIIQRNNLVTKLDFLGKEYKLSFHIFITKLDSGVMNILHLTIGGDSSKYGDRTPLVSLYNPIEKTQ